ncbi:MAG: adenylyltransferase/cytidyltransferase family protein [Oscillatoriales cyanobacterium SM2_2_1]|nr:adenylyltransferase/cytidyltransferase family protein [Oscillatoriales cyanobacterium SM2_2_1]
MIYEQAELLWAISQKPEQWRPLVLTNGCFDLLHLGHVRYLVAARALGRALVVGVNRDATVRLLKGSTRPLVPDWQRGEVLAALRAVDGVVLFGDRTADGLIRALNPDIYVKGGDYHPETLPEFTTLRELGVRLELIQVEVPTSTSQIVSRIAARQVAMTDTTEAPKLS